MQVHESGGHIVIQLLFLGFAILLPAGNDFLDIEFDSALNFNRVIQRLIGITLLVDVNQGILAGASAGLRQALAGLGRFTNWEPRARLGIVPLDLELFLFRGNALERDRLGVVKAPVHARHNHEIRRLPAAEPPGLVVPHAIHRDAERRGCGIRREHVAGNVVRHEIVQLAHGGCGLGVWGLRPDDFDGGTAGRERRGQIGRGCRGHSGV